MVIVVMGVSGCGKTTIGEALAKQLAIDFYDADDFHPPANIQKMSQGIPLNDLDRKEWLLAINQKAQEIQNAVFACSALKEKYRKMLFNGLGNSWELVYLKGDYELIMNRLKKRTGHFMSPKLLQSQFDTLEEPEYGIWVSIEQNPQEILAEILEKLNADDQKTGISV